MNTEDKMETRFHSSEKKHDTEYDQSVIHISNKISILIKTISLFIVACGILVAGGWLFNIPVLTYIVPGFVTMKFTTAISFVCSGVIVYFMSESFLNKKDISMVLLPIPIFIIVLIMGTFLISDILGIVTGVEVLFVEELSQVAGTFVPGKPSIGTVFNFILIITSGLLTIFNPVNLSRLISKIGFVMLLISLAALLGYILKIPELYYLIPYKSTGMAIHTTFLFILIGICLVLLGKTKKTYEN